MSDIAVFCVSGFLGLNCLNSMRLHRNLASQSNGVIATQAVQITGVAGLGAGGITCAAQLGISIVILTIKGQLQICIAQSVSGGSLFSVVSIADIAVIVTGSTVDTAGGRNSVHPDSGLVAVSRNLNMTGNIGLAVVAVGAVSPAGGGAGSSLALNERGVDVLAGSVDTGGVVGDHSRACGSISAVNHFNGGDTNLTVGLAAGIAYAKGSGGSTDCHSRFGGDVFAIVSHDTTVAGAVSNLDGVNDVAIRSSYGKSAGIGLVNSPVCTAGEVLAGILAALGSNRHIAIHGDGRILGIILPAVCTGISCDIYTGGSGGGSALTAALTFYLVGVNSKQIGVLVYGIAAAGLHSGSGISIGFRKLTLGPADEGITLGQDAGVAGQSNGITQMYDLGRSHGAVFPEEHIGGSLGSKVDLHSAVLSCVDYERVATLGYSCAAAGHRVTGNIVACSGNSGDHLAADGNSTESIVICHSSDGICSRTGSLAGRRNHVGRHSFIKQQECQFGIVNEDVTGTGDGLNRVVTAQLPGINRVFCHPLQQNVLALDNALRTPHRAGIAPTDIDVQHDTGYVTVEVVLAAGFAVGIVEAAAFTVSLVAAGAILRLSSGTQHHNIIFALTGGITLTVGPGMLTVPGRTAVPCGTDLVTGIEGGDSAAAVLAVGVSIHFTGIAVTGDHLMVGHHQVLQLSVQGTAGNGAQVGRTFQRRQILISSIVLNIESFRIAGQLACNGFASAPVVQPTACSIRADSHTGQDAQTQNQHHDHGQTALHHLFHNVNLISESLLYF